MTVKLKTAEMGDQTYLGALNIHVWPTKVKTMWETLGKYQLEIG